jgi:Holliday junction DNA helicase RuvB
MVDGHAVIDREQARAALDRLDVDPRGLDTMDRKILLALIHHFNGGPVGVKTIATACSEEVRTLEEIYEPYLIQCGFLKRTSRGRVATGKAYKHLKIIE